MGEGREIKGWKIHLKFEVDFSFWIGIHLTHIPYNTLTTLGRRDWDGRSIELFVCENRERKGLFFMAKRGGD